MRPRRRWGARGDDCGWATGRGEGWWLGHHEEMQQGGHRGAPGSDVEHSTVLPESAQQRPTTSREPLTFCEELPVTGQINKRRQLRKKRAKKKASAPARRHLLPVTFFFLPDAPAFESPRERWCWWRRQEKRSLPPAQNYMSPKAI